MSEATRPLQPLEMAKDMFLFFAALEHFGLTLNFLSDRLSAAYVWDKGLLLRRWGDVRISLCTDPSAKLVIDGANGSFRVKPPAELVLVWSCHKDAEWVRPGKWQQGVELWVAEKLKLISQLQAEEDEKKRIHDAEVDEKLVKAWKRF